LELAVLKDLGYDIDLKRFFGRSFYQDGTAPITNLDSYDLNALYAVGLHIHANNHDITQVGDISAVGQGATGIRIDGHGNFVMIEDGTTIFVDGTYSTGVLASYGASNTIVHRGAIRADGAGSRGILLDFGTNLLDGESDLDSQVLDNYLVDSLDITGSIIAPWGNAIEIGSTAAVREINLMRGAELEGNIFCNGLTNSGIGRILNAPTLTFGHLADTTGRKMEGLADPGFFLRMNGYIYGSTLMTGQLVGGTSVFNNYAEFDSLDVGPQATLAGNGTVWTMDTVENRGAISPGDATSPGDSQIGTLTIDGNLHNSAEGQINAQVDSAGTVPGTHNDFLDVTLSATFDGGTINVEAEGSASDYELDSRYRFLTARSGLIVNTTPITQDNLPALRFASEPDAYNYWLVVMRDRTLAQIAETSNQRAWGAYFDEVKQTNMDPGVQALRNSLDGMDEVTDSCGAMDQVVGDIHGSLSMLGVQSMSNFVRVLTSKIRPELCNRLIPEWDNGCCVREGWVQGYGIGGKADSDGNAHAASYSTAGTIVGLSGYTMSDADCGFFYNYEAPQTTLEGVSARCSGDTHRFGGYFDHCVDGNYYLFTGFAGFDNYDVSRYIAFDEYEGTVNSDHAGWQTAFYGERGWIFQGDVFRLTPYLGLQYAYLGQEGFSESGEDSLQLNVQHSHFHSFRGVGGARLSCNPYQNYFSLNMDAVWWHEFLADTTANYTAALAMAEGASFKAYGLDLGRDWLVFGPSIEWRPADWRMFADYQVILNDSQVLHTGSGGAEWSW
jgi:uncharacterized protein with beta-barrel porin domain